MKDTALRSLFVSLAAVGFAAAAASQSLGGLWILRIKNPQHKVVSTLTVRFSNEAANSCLGGPWKRVVVQAAQTTDKKFFPLSDPLSYQLEGSKLTIGRNEICDAYLHLSAPFDGAKAEGSYGSLGLNGWEPLGEFSLVRAKAPRK